AVADPSLGQILAVDLERGTEGRHLELDKWLEQLGQVLAVNLEKGTKRILARNLSGHLRRLAVSPDGRWVAAAPYWFPAQPITVWDVGTGKRERELDSIYNGKVVFSPDGRWLVAALPGEFRFWTTGTWEPGPVLRRTQGGNNFGDLAFSP